MRNINVNEFIKIYRSVDGVIGWINRIKKLDRSINILMILAAFLGIMAILSSVFFFTILTIVFTAIYLILSAGIGLRINHLLKKKFNDVHYLGNKKREEYINKVIENLNFDLRIEKDRNIIEDFLNFHREKEMNKRTFMSLLKPGLAWIIFIFPVVFPLIIDATQIEKVVFSIVLFSIYIIGFSLIIQGVMLEVNNYSKYSIITGILELINDLKIRNLHKEIMCNKVKELLKDRKFESLTTDLLSEAGFENVNNMNPYIPVLYSISEDIDIEMLQQIINRNN
ncbi:hypothetical protein [Sporosarcina sp. USHLN248]|uniref:hypothetical protein n=1 Tax=Sporosarcina sp. USHLN248 TaxID=3081300 RepID=UPI0030188476